MEKTNEVYRTIRQLRVEAGMTQKEAAGKAGLTQSHLSMIESGKRRVTADVAASLFRLYGVDFLKEIPTSSEHINAADMRSAEVLGVISGLLSSAGQDLRESVDKYLSLEMFLLLRRLYLANRFNSEKLFGISSEDALRLEKLLENEPERIVRCAKYSELSRSEGIEPPTGGEAEFRRIVRDCENIAVSVLGI